MSSARPILVDRGLAVPIFRKIAGISGACLTLALLTDVAYWRTSNLMWSNFSAWLLLAGAVAGALALLVGLVELLVRRAARPLWGGFGWALCGLIALVLAIVNNLVHAGDGWTAVVPLGLTLSAATVVVLLVGTALELSTRATRVAKVVQS